MDIVLVVDVSGSMDAAAKVEQGGEQVSCVRARARARARSRFS